MIEIKVLSAQEEYNFLKDFWRILKEDAENFRCEGKYACGEYYLGHGSSRMAFVLPEDLVKTYFSDWNLPLDKSYVVKINMGLEVLFSLRMKFLLIGFMETGIR